MSAPWPGASSPSPAQRGAKIFGIGLPKTGTTSLHEALKILGFRSCHFPHDAQTVAELRAGQYRLSVLEKVDAVSDVPIPAIFPQLDRAWPGSRFILTPRPLDDWLRSCRDAPFNAADAVPEPGSMRDFYRTLLYGCTVFNEDRFAWVHRAHHLLVDAFFAGERRKDLLVLDVCGGAGWEPLCEFLGVPVPDVPFPRQNVKGVENGKRLQPA